MKIQIDNHILHTALNDLLRPHETALERVGYFIGDYSHDIHVLKLHYWLNFDDDMYEECGSVGAQIGKRGMKKLMSTALSTGKSFVQFHLHEFQKTPSFSKTDLLSLNEIVPALFNFSKATCHGALIKGSCDFSSLLWFPNSEQPVLNHFNIIF